MDSEQMSKDFLFLLDLCRKPENVFPEDSKELQLTRKWLNHLSSYECESTDEMRIVNLYMSHLCAALVKGTLYGPFAKEPPREKLQRIDFKPDIPAVISNELLMTPELRGSPLTLPTNEMSRRPETSMFAEETAAEYPQQMDSGVGYSQHLSNNQTSGASSNANRIKHYPGIAL